MLLTISTTYRPATDLGYLLHKNPERIQEFELSFGKAHVFYPVAGDELCTAALLIDVDPINLVRGKAGSSAGRTLDQYVNDRPYAASSYMSVALSSVFGTALSGTCKQRPVLVSAAIPLAATICALPCSGGEDLIRRLFAPLGYSIAMQGQALDDRFPEWGPSRYFDVTLSATIRLSELLTHLYVLIPTLDDNRHYFVGSEEVDKMIRKGEGWLQRHPEQETIVNRYLRHHRSLTRDALARLVPDDPEIEKAEDEHAAQEEQVERKLSLHELRLDAVTDALKESGAGTVLDLGCGEGRLLSRLLDERQFERILGMDVSYRALEKAASRLRLNHLPPIQRERIMLIQGSLIYRDARLDGYDSAAVVEVIEHLDPARLAAFERVLFLYAHPGVVVVTTPNVEYNPKFETLPSGIFRHKDHRFEWTRAEFGDWAARIAAEYGYDARISPIGPEDVEVGAPSQMAVFTKSDVNTGERTSVPLVSGDMKAANGN